MGMEPATRRVSIELWHENDVCSTFVGQASVPVDGFYEPPSRCDDWHVCGHSAAKLSHKAFGTEYQWPFARGEPSTKELKDYPGPCHDCHCCCCGRHDFEEQEELLERGLFLDSYDKPPAPPQQSTMAAQGSAKMGSEEKFHAINVVAKNGLRLEQQSTELRCDRDVVMAAVRENGAAIRFASDQLRNDLHVQLAAAGTPRPMVLTLHDSRKEVGLLWVYFIMHG